MVPRIWLTYMLHEREEGVQRGEFALRCRHAGKVNGNLEPPCVVCACVACRYAGNGVSDILGQHE